MILNHPSRVLVLLAGTVLGIAAIPYMAKAAVLDPYVSITTASSTISIAATTTLQSESASGVATNPAGVSAALSGITPFTITITNGAANPVTYTNVALIPFTVNSHVQLWISPDGGTTWTDFEKSGYAYPSGTALPPGGSITLQIYAIADQEADYNVSSILVDESNLGAYVAQSDLQLQAVTPSISISTTPAGCVAGLDLSTVYVDPLANASAADGTAQNPCVSISAAIAAATSSATIHLAAGTYLGSIVLTKPLSFVGAGTTTILRLPNTVSLAAITSNGNTYHPIVKSDGYNLSLANLTIDGNGMGDSTNLVTGVGVSTASATITNVSLQNTQIGVLLSDVASANVSSTTVTSTDASSTTSIGMLIGYDLTPGQMSGSIHDNTFTGTAYGIQLNDYNNAGSAPLHLTFTRNSFVGTHVAGFLSNDNITISKNYWNAASGPTYSDNPSGTGDAIAVTGRANPIYSPWYIDPALLHLSNETVATTTNASSTDSIPSSSNSSNSSGGGGSSGGSGGSSGGATSGGSVSVARTTTAYAKGVSAGLLATTTPARGRVLGAATYHFTRDLTMKSKGDDVQALESYLITAGFAIKDGPTRYFGAQARAALAAFQKAHGITPAAGYFGQKTRVVVNAGIIETAPVPGSH